MSPNSEPKPPDHADHVIDMDQQPTDHPRPLPWHVIAVVVALIASGVAGYAIGAHRSASTVRPTPSPTQVVKPFPAVVLTWR